MTLLTANDIKTIPFKKANHRLHYGQEAQQYADLRLPNTKGPHPILVIIHGGCWLSKFANLDIMSAFAERFTDKGFSTWNIEYRCMDQGGGWPGTFLDVGQAVDYLDKIAAQYDLDLSNVTVIGHSSGGHLALWVSSRHQLPLDSPLISHNMIRIKAAVNLAGEGDLRAFLPIQRIACGESVIEPLLGNSSTTFDERILHSSPIELLPTGVKQLVISGSEDRAVPVSLSEAYLQAAKKAGDNVEFICIPNAGHFEVISPKSNAWPIIEEAVLKLILNNEGVSRS